jgi:putative methyltransferase (TIGR04325 family)
MNQIVKSSKRILRGSVENTPILRDFYYYHWLFPRNPNLYRGVFGSFAEASAAVPPRTPSGYDHADLHNTSLKQNLDLEEISKFKPIDYPILVWLGEIFKDRSTVFDFGGNTGSSYYAYRNYISYPPAMQWLICDVPAAVQVGNELLKRFSSPGLSYTTDIADAEGFDIFLTCGTLQYLEPSLSELLSQLQSKPQHLIINHVPFYNGSEYVTLQNLLIVDPVNQTQIASYTPYKIQNRAHFIDSIEKLGYELVDSWQQNRTCYIPFKPERFVDFYHGFYFRLQLLKP